MNLVTGLIRPTRGRVEVLGVRSSDSEALFRIVGYCSQFDSFPRGLSGRMFVESYLRVHGYTAGEARKLADAAIDRGGLGGAAGRRTCGCSAGRRQGVPLHRLARRGEEVEREPKKVHIERLELLRFEAPDAEISVECGGGTYVRVLAADLGSALGCGAYLASLRRLCSGPFEIEQALDVDRCRQAGEARELEDMLIPPQAALDLPTMQLAPPAVARVKNGAEISPGTLERNRPGSRVSALDEEGRMIAVLELRADRRLWPLRVLSSGRR